MTLFASGRWGVAALLVLVLALGGCSRSAEPSPQASQSEDPRARADSRLEPSTVTIRVTGAHELAWSGVQDVRVVRTGVMGGPVNLFSVGIEAPHRSDDPTLRFRWAVDLLNAFDDKPATFPIASDAEASGDLKSLAFVILLKVVDAAKDKDIIEDWEEVVFLKEFRKLDEGCELVVGDAKGTSGSLTCPKLSNDEGESVSLSVSWEPRTA